MDLYEKLQQDCQPIPKSSKKKYIIPIAFVSLIVIYIHFHLVHYKIPYPVQYAAYERETYATFISGDNTWVGGTFVGTIENGFENGFSDLQLHNDGSIEILYFINGEWFVTGPVTGKWFPTLRGYIVFIDKEFTDIIQKRLYLQISSERDTDGWQMLRCTNSFYEGEGYIYYRFD